MDIELLKTFIEVKNTRHFGKAAENLYLTQAAVSARVKQLERILGAPLFTRYRNNLQLTTTGERLVAHAEGIIIAWERARQDVSLKKDQKHALALGATSGLWDLVLQECINIIHQEMPELALRAESHSEEILVRRLMERTMDLALIYEAAKITDLLSIPVSSAELILVSSKGDSSVEDAVNKGYVSVDWGISFNISFAQFFPETNAPLLHTTLARIALDFILCHGGSAYLPYRLVHEHLDSGALTHLADAPVIQRPIFAIYHKENRFSDDIEQMIKIIAQVAAPITTDIEQVILDQAMIPAMGDLPEQSGSS